MSDTPDATVAGHRNLGDLRVARMGYGAMQLAGPGVWGPPADRDAAVAVLRQAVEWGVDHIDTSDFYGPHVTNEIIREALHPYPENLVLVTKVGARRGEDASWLPALSPDELRSAVHDNLNRLGLDRLDVVNLRLTDEAGAGPSAGSLAEQFTALAELREQGLIRHLGLSNVTAEQVTEARTIAPVVCVQNLYNLVHRVDDPLVDLCAEQDIAFVPFFPLGGFSPIQSDRLSTIATRLGHTPMQVALAWLLARSPAMLLIPGTSSTGHLADNIAAAAITLDQEVRTELDGLSG